MEHFTWGWFCWSVCGEVHAHHFQVLAFGNPLQTAVAFAVADLTVAAAVVVAGGDAVAAVDWANGINGGRFCKIFRCLWKNVIKCVKILIWNSRQWRKVEMDTYVEWFLGKNFHFAIGAQSSRMCFYLLLNNLTRSVQVRFSMTDTNIWDMHLTNFLSIVLGWTCFLSFTLDMCIYILSFF